MTMAFKHNENILFNPDMVTALNKGETLQIKGGWGPSADQWRDWKQEKTYFGPWYYHEGYEWRVKPATIEIEVETVVKTKIEIPTPFKGEIPKETEYSRVYKYKDEWKVQYNHFNSTPSTAQCHTDNDLVYLDTASAAEAFKILTGE